MRKSMGEAVYGVKPERFGRYVLLDKLGEGGMAEVFRAVMPGVKGWKRTFVVKKILSRLSQSAEFTEMFIHEARICALLNHPNIVQVHDFGNVDGHYFLAMEYLRGRDVLALIRRQLDRKRPIPLPVVAFIAHEVARGLAYAHSLTDSDNRPQNLVHCDVSPSNIMCLREGGVKILDFGIAKTISEAMPETTQQKTFKGKLTYMAPERLRNEPLDGRSDLYSLGVVLWEMLTCKRLFQGANEVERFKNVLEMTVQAPSALRPEVPAKLDAIVMRVLERDPANRYATGQAMADDLEDVMRETKYQARMLPSLLIESFGSGAHSSHVAMSTLTTESFEAMTPSMTPSDVSSSQAWIGSTWLRTVSRMFNKRWQRWGIAGVAVLASVFLVWGLSLVMGKWQKPNPNPPISIVNQPSPELSSKVPTEIPTPTANPVVTVPGLNSETAGTAIPNPPLGKSKRAVVNKKPIQVNTNPRKNPIGEGLSIDPFIEAESRRQR